MTTMNRNHRHIETSAVTESQLARCHRIVAADGVFYQVESESEPGTEYEVRFDKAHQCYTCSCPSGLEAFANVRNANGLCKHVVWSVAHGQAFRKEQARLNRIARLEDMGLTTSEALAAINAQAIINGKPASDEELVRIYGPRNRRPSEAEMNAMAVEADEFRSEERQAAKREYQARKRDGANYLNTRPFSLMR